MPLTCICSCVPLLLFRLHHILCRLNAASSQLDLQAEQHQQVGYYYAGHTCLLACEAGACYIYNRILDSLACLCQVPSVRSLTRSKNWMQHWLSWSYMLDVPASSLLLNSSWWNADWEAQQQVVSDLRHGLASLEALKQRMQASMTTMQADTDSMQIRYLSQIPCLTALRMLSTAIFAL